MTTTSVTGRVWQLGERLHARVRRFFDTPLGPDAKPLEIRAAMLDDIERQVTPLGGGRRVFPFPRLVGRVVAPGADRASCEATFTDFEDRVRARLAELGCDAPSDLDVRVVVLKKAPAEWQTGRIFALDYRKPSDTASRRGARRTPRPAGHHRRGHGRTAGLHDRQPHRARGPRGRAGRPVRPRAPQSNRIRRGRRRGCRDRGPGARAVHVGRGGGRVPRLRRREQQRHARVPRRREHRVPSRDSRGVRVRTGDEIQFGRARVRIKVRVSG